MLPTNVMTFMKKMVTTEDTTPSALHPSDAGGTFGKLKQTLSSSLLTAQDRVNKMSPRPSLIPSDDSIQNNCSQQQQNYELSLSQGYNNHSNTTTNIISSITSAATTATTTTAATAATTAAAAATVATTTTTIMAAKNLNKQQKIESGRRADACRVCLKSFKPDDYFNTCFECQHRVCEDCASYSKLDDNDMANMWRCSVCRRKMASRICIPQDSADSMLDVPILEALQRRHSDVKLGSTQTLAPGNGAALLPPRSPELRRHSDVSPASLKELEKLKGNKTPGGDLDWRRSGQSIAPSRSSSPPHLDETPFVNTVAMRKLSQIPRQHSYDDDTTVGIGLSDSMNLNVGNDCGPGIPLISRRKSAYDVFTASGVQNMGQNVLIQRSPGDGIIAAQSVMAGPMKGSYRAIHASDDLMNDDSPNSDKSSPVLTVDGDRRIRRRGSQLPDLAALQSRGALTSNLPVAIPQPLAAITGPNLEDLEAPPRQTSMDGEAIKIVIHDVDSGPICSSKRRILLRKDPKDNAHRTRGFGMRVVGGKTGTDGKLFAYIVWTVPGGPAEKNGLQQGDKILEWNNMSLIDRSFEEVNSIMDNTGDVVELLVEHASDFRMCDLFDENLSISSTLTTVESSVHRSSADASIGLGVTTDSEAGNEKNLASPTRRKLPKTPV